MEKVRAVSIRGSRNYIRAINEYAEDQGKRTADLIRGIIDAAIGKELQPYLKSLAQRVPENGHQPETEPSHAS